MTPVGILAAMPDELAGLLAAFESPRVVSIGRRDYHVGSLHGRPCVAVLARIGKVAAAATTVTLIREFGAHAVVCTGLAGGVGPDVRVGDLVVGRDMVQHDMDARPLAARFEIPLLAKASFPGDAALNDALLRAASDFLAQDLARAVPRPVLERFGIAAPAVWSGTIASGDRFVQEAGLALALREALPDLRCVEMEGAAVAQVCHELDVPCAVLRTISDRADATAHVDFSAFLKEVASVYSAGVLKRFLGAPT